MTILESPVQAPIINVVELPFDPPTPLSYRRPRLIPMPRRSQRREVTLGDELVRQLMDIDGVKEVFYDTTNRCRLLLLVEADLAIHIEDIILAMIESLADECRQISNYLLDEFRTALG